MEQIDASKLKVGNLVGFGRGGWEGWYGHVGVVSKVCKQYVVVLHENGQEAGKFNMNGRERGSGYRGNYLVAVADARAAIHNANVRRARWSQVDAIEKAIKASRTSVGDYAVTEECKKEWKQMIDAIPLYTNE